MSVSDSTLVLFMISFWEFSDSLKQYDIPRSKENSMANVFETINTLEQRALGVVAWVTAHGNQLEQISKQADQTKKEVADIFKRIAELKEAMEKGYK